MATKYPAVPDVDKVTTLSEDITNLKNKVTHILEGSFTVHDVMKDLVAPTQSSRLSKHIGICAKRKQQLRYGHMQKNNQQPYFKRYGNQKRKKW